MPRDFAASNEKQVAHGTSAFVACSFMRWAIAANADMAMTHWLIRVENKLSHSKPSSTSWITQDMARFT